MTSIDGSNTSSPSTKWEFRKVKVKRAAVPPGERSAAGRRTPHLRVWNRRKPLGIRVSYRGGNELDWRVEARGRRWTFDGFLAFEDVMAVVLGERNREYGRGIVVEVTNEHMFGVVRDFPEGLDNSTG